MLVWRKNKLILHAYFLYLLVNGYIYILYLISFNMVLHINPKFDYYEYERPFVPKDSFDFFATYFESTNRGPELKGYGEFIFDFEKIKHFSNKELSYAACHIMAYGVSFEGSDFIKISHKLLERGISEELFYSYLKDLELSELKEFTTELIHRISSTFNNPYSNYIMNTKLLKKRSNEYHYLIDQLNKNKLNPITLEKIIDLSAKPVTLKYDEQGILNLLDVDGVLHQYDGFKKINAHQLDIKFDESHLISKIQPTMFVKDDRVYLSIVDDLLILPFNGAQVISSNSMVKTNTYKYHDSIIKDDYLLLSCSQNNQRFIAIKTLDGEKVIFSSEYPKDFNGVAYTCSTKADETLRIGLHNNILYFPTKQGLAAFDGIKLIDVDKKNNGGDFYKGYHPSTQFSFGDNFLVNVMPIVGDDLDSKVIGIYEIRYSEGLMKNTDFRLPKSFDLKWVMPFPKMGVPTLRSSVPAAYKNMFAMTDHSFNQLRFYKYNS